MLTLWYRTTRTKHTARASQIFCGESSFRLTWFMIMIYTRFSADSRSSLTKKLAEQSPLFATCTFAIRTSRSLRYLATPKLVLTHTNYGKAGFTQSEFELHALSEVPGTPKMVLCHIHYGKAGCDREITPRLGVCDRDITTRSAHALIGHCLGNSHVTCQNLNSVVLKVSLFVIAFLSLHVNSVPTCLPVGTGLLNFARRLSVFACLTKSMCLLRIEQCLLESIELTSRDRLLCTFAKPNVPCFFEFLQRSKGCAVKNWTTLPQ